ncbi:TetR/AcrR family transcriptional regulator [Rhodococcus triatomae]|uniref:DNA-binding transcriptional regulator, AcrR family n=1 Tax=Rhodococcus triatomae TaxID=300028 RepID=A0A1G8A8Q8_9NOCA|nr:TetR/AcrR family transcriptional regulator [Rhodococcus triatomae]QNG17832.1 TetR/AcrR family transcriptional regulator [Rhodococcus triatomae]QNG22500.1 TetR/AcrR family transcriptional regulator [Rhodococcus triatomae]SDH17344.1 DNA-binding transcriptional regulator, AcrR family [Rhodococcus triatomae]
MSSDEASCPTEFDPRRLLTPRAAQIVGCARALLEDTTWDSVTMRAVAEALGIRAPSLYKHFRDKAALQDALIAQALKEMGEATRPVESVAGLVADYRDTARAHPNLYRLATSGPLRRDSLPPGLEDWSGAPFLMATGEPFLAQALWAATHGAVILDLDGRYPTGRAPEQTWHELAATFSSRADRPRRHGR